MLGAIVGDIIGSVHEGSGTKRTDFPLFDRYCRFTDDTVLTLAVAEKLVRGGDYAGRGKSPDRADACVWALTELKLGRRREPALRAL